MKKTLGIIQVLAKVAKIICQVAFVLTIIGAVSSLLAIGGLVLVQVFAGETLAQVLAETEEALNLETMYFACGVAVVSCIAACVTTKLTQKYLENELDAGTPFTMEGANELFRLGIIQIIIEVAMSALIGVAYVVLQIFFPNIQDVSLGADISLGLLMLFLSLIFKCAVQMLEEKMEGNKEGPSDPFEELYDPQEKKQNEPEEKKPMENEENQEFFQ